MCESDELRKIVVGEQAIDGIPTKQIRQFWDRLILMRGNPCIWEKAINVETGVGFVNFLLCFSRLRLVTILKSVSSMPGVKKHNSNPTNAD